MTCEKECLDLDPVHDEAWHVYYGQLKWQVAECKHSWLLPFPGWLQAAYCLSPLPWKRHVSLNFLSRAQSSLSQPLCPPLGWFSVNSPEAEAWSFSQNLLSSNCMIVWDTDVILGRKQRLAVHCSTGVACPLSEDSSPAFQDAVQHLILDLDFRNKLAPRSPFQYPQQQCVKLCLKLSFKY